MKAAFVPTISSSADAAMLLFMGLVGLLLTAKPTSALAITWGADAPEVVQLPQCEDLTFAFSGTNSIMQFQTKDKFERCDFNRSLTILSTKNNGVYTITGSSMGHKRGKEYLGSDFLDLCDRQNMKMQVEIIPSFTAHMDTTCVPVEGRRPISRIDVGSISRCERACVKKDECLGELMYWRRVDGKNMQIIFPCMNDCFLRQRARQHLSNLLFSFSCAIIVPSPSIPNPL